MKNSPLIENLKNPSAPVPFDKIDEKKLHEAILWGMKKARENIKEIKEETSSPTFKNTILALESADDALDFFVGTFYNLLAVKRTDSFQKVAEKIAPALSSFYNEIFLDEVLFQKVKTVCKKKGKLKGEDKTLVEKYFKSFTNNGALLKKADKKKFAELDKKLSLLKLKFKNHLVKETNSFKLVIDKKSDLEGLPEDILKASKEDAVQKGLKNKWVFTLEAPSYVPFVTYSKRRKLREKIWRAYNSRCFGGEFDNRKVISEIAQLRKKRAQLLGYKNHSEWVLSDRMIKTPKDVLSFLTELLKVSKKQARLELGELKDLASQDGIKEILPWDVSFYTERLKKKKLDLDEEELRPFLKVENVVQGVFSVAKKLYGLSFVKSNSHPVYHPDVKVYKVYDKQKKFLSLFYMDLFPRAGKSGGAWMTNYKDQGFFLGKNIRPHVSIVCNFTKPLKNRPSLLTFGEVLTLFHEFGHALHGMLSSCKYRSLSGTNVKFDFVEYPSQILENWACEEEVLRGFAKHFKTKKTLPKEKIQKIKEASQFMAGWRSLRQLSFGFLDMAWHNWGGTKGIKDVHAFERKALEKTRLLPSVKESLVSSSFSHIFDGGYSSGYYSYKWSEVLSADTFNLFKSRGVFNKNVAQKFRRYILSKGATEDPFVLFKKLRGRKPLVKYLLLKDGLIHEK